MRVSNPMYGKMSMVQVRNIHSMVLRVFNINTEVIGKQNTFKQ